MSAQSAAGAEPVGREPGRAGRWATAFARSRWPEVLVLAVAALTRFWRLDYHSVWFDEAVSLYWAGADPAYTWQVTFRLVEEKHPPVYYLGLHVWQQVLDLAGLAHNDAALRAFGSLLGVLAVWGLLLLAGRLSGRATGLIAGGLAALSPILVWYSQELRMFQPAAAAIVWAAYCLARAWRTDAGWLPRLGWWLGLIVALTLALYAYLFSAFVLPAAGLTLLALAAVERRWRRFAEGAAALAAAGLIFLPLARNAWAVNAGEGTPGVAFASFSENLLRLLRIHTVWRVNWPDWLMAAALILLGGLVVVGLAAPWRKAAGSGPDRSSDRLWLALWIGVPVLVANLLLSRSGSIFEEDRYLLFLAPFILWAAGRGAAVVGQRWTPAGWLLALVALALIAGGLPRLWTPRVARENWRAATDYVVNYERSGADLPSAAVAHVDYVRLPLEWYLRQAFSFQELPVFFPYGGALTADQVESTIAPPLQGIVDLGAATLWLAQSHLDGVDDQRLVEGWLNQNFPVITEQYPAGIKLSGYALRSRFPELPALGERAIHPDAELAPGLRLLACELLTPALAATDEALHPPSGWAHVRLWWQATEPVAQDFMATVQMIGPEGVWGERLHRDNEALRRSPTSGWTPGEVMRDEVDVNLNPVTPPGEYPILVGLVDGQGQAAGERVECGRVTVVGR